jgi:hypothetical protein
VAYSAPPTLSVDPFELTASPQGDIPPPVMP